MIRISPLRCPLLSGLAQLSGRCLPWMLMAVAAAAGLTFSYLPLQRELLSGMLSYCSEEHSYETRLNYWPMPETILMARRIILSLLAEVYIYPLIYDLIQQLNQSIEIFP